MLKKDVLNRTQIRTIYSSQRQERMKIYFQLSEKYNQCIQPCKLQPNQQRETCLKQCQNIFDEYAKILEPRYRGQQRQRLEMQVRDMPTFDARRREDRQGWFYDIVGMSFKEWIGHDTTPKVNTTQERV